MNANLNPGIDTGKVLNLKHLLTVLAITIITVMVLQKIIRQNIVIYGTDGKETGRGEIKFSLGLGKMK